MTPDAIRFAQDGEQFAAFYKGRAGNWYVGIGADRAAALRSLADNLDPFTCEDVDSTDDLKEISRQEMRRYLGEERDE